MQDSGMTGLKLHLLRGYWIRRWDEVQRRAKTFEDHDENKSGINHAKSLKRGQTWASSILFG